MVAWGWGDTKNGTLSKDMRKVTLREMPFDECKNHYKSRIDASLSDGLNPTHMFCAGGRNAADTFQVGAIGLRTSLAAIEESRHSAGLDSRMFPSHASQTLHLNNID